MKAWVLPLSALLHAAALAALLPWPAGRGQARAEAPPIEVELVQQSAAAAGAPPANPANATALTKSPTPADAEAAPRPAGSTQIAAQPASPPAVNLGDADESREAMDVTGRGVIPPGPDSAYRNQPPAYPVEAARAGAEGTVSLLVHVSAQGMPQEVAIASSSGSATLDRAARNAVRRWHFTPAHIQGTPVPFDYPLDIRFILGDRQ